MANLPRLLDGRTMTEKARLHPDTLSITLKSQPLSTASMVLPDTDPDITVGDWVRLTAPNGETCVMYVKSIQTNYTKKQRTVNLEHTMGLLSNTVVFGKKTYSSTQTVKSVISNLLSYQPSGAQYWTIDQCDFTNGQPWEFNNTDIMSALGSVTDCLQDWVWTFNQESLPWKLNLKTFETTASCEMRMSRNITGLNVTVDKSSMYTRIYPVGRNNRDISSVNGGVKYLDRNTSAYGIISKVLTDQSITDVNTLKAFGAAELKRNADPMVTVSVDGLLLADLTGEPIDRLLINKVCALPLPQYGVTINERIIEMSWPDAIRAPEVVKITMANQRQTASNLIKKSSSSAARSRTGNGCQLAEDEAHIQQLEGSYAFRNDDQVGAVLGRYTYDPATGRVTLIDGGISYLRRLPNGTVQHVDIVGSINHAENEISTIEGSAIWQDRDSIIAAVGKVGQIDGRVGEIEGSVFWTTRDSILSAVGRISAIDGRVDEIEGSSLWINRENINAVSGKFTIDANGNVVLKDGAGILVNRKQVSSIVKNLTENKGMLAELDDSTYTIYAINDLSAANMTKTALLKVSKTGIDIGTLDTTVTTYGQTINNITGTLNGSGLVYGSSGNSFYIRSIVSGLGTNNVVYGATLLSMIRGTDGAYRIGLGNLDPDVEGYGQSIDDIEASSLWVNRDDIVAKTNMFTIRGTSRDVLYLNPQIKFRFGDSTAYQEFVMGGNVIAAINASLEKDGTKQLKIKADRIVLDGLVKATDIEADRAYVHDLMTQKSNTRTLWANTIRTKYLEISNTSMHWDINGADRTIKLLSKTALINATLTKTSRVFSLALGDDGRIYFVNSSGARSLTCQIMQDVTLNKSSSTANYLGYQLASNETEETEENA